MADFKKRLSNTYPSGGAAFAAMVQGARARRALSRKPAKPWPGAALSVDDFVRSTSKFRPPLTRQQAEFVFRGMDADHDGMLMQAEFLEILWTGNFLVDVKHRQEEGANEVPTTMAPSRALASTSTTLAATSAPPAASATSKADKYLTLPGVAKHEGDSLRDYADRHYSLQECEGLCDKTVGCNSFAYFDGECYLKDRCIHAGDPLGEPSDFRTHYKPCHLQAYRYVKLGTGYCKDGYYAGGDPEDAVNLPTCQARCSSEPQCQFFSLHLKDTCSRYSSEAGNCSSRPMGQADHVSYRREVLILLRPPLPTTTVAAPAAAASRGTAAPVQAKVMTRLREGQVQKRAPSQPPVMDSGAAPGLKDPPEGLLLPATIVVQQTGVGSAAKVPITMDDFKARMLKAYATALHAFQALGNNPSGLEDFVRGATTFRPPLTFEQAQYAFRGLDADHDELLRSFEFFEVIECGHFFPSAEELKALHAAPSVLRATAELRGGQPSEPAEAKRSPGPAASRSPGSTSSPPARGLGLTVPVLATIFGVVTCGCGVFLGMGLRLVSRARDAKGNSARTASYSAMPFVSWEGTSSTRSSAGSSGKHVISL